MRENHCEKSDAILLLASISDYRFDRPLTEEGETLANTFETSHTPCQNQPV